MSLPELTQAIPQLPTGDINETADFFESKLGFTVLNKFPDHGHLIVSRGNAEIHFWQAPSKEEAKAIASQSSCYIRVNHIEELFAEFKQSGAPFGYELAEQPWGMKEMQVNEPYGNAIRFGESIG
ncbi:bleomycin resistance protein [Oceanicoccus sagamiensis]|uniref:Bleomycin resistance protein n=1 Tax=Oceanicoccus sagamiensis TaxID=716816 RepID=A0A1X9NCE8_9GAMM|nr:VOC family protein [Oceanicoccus sagamiensis]ARN75256.1 bleomycin resistance protein [Oceanicoccus sagamiensis]